MALNPPDPGRNNTWYLDRCTDSVLVFVHGIFSDSQGCWQRSTPAVYWPRLIAEDDRFQKYSIFLGGYYTAIDAGPYDVGPCAAELFAALNREIDGARSVLSRQEILFVCHSTGGIVARYMLETETPSFAGKLVGLLLIASPSYGAKWATRLRLLSRLYNQQLGSRLEWGSWSLRDLDDRFRRLIAQRRIPGLVGLEAYENHFIIHRKWLPDRNVVVSQESAGKYFGPPVLLRNTDHFTTVKPNDRNHPSYELLFDFVVKIDRERTEMLARIGHGGAPSTAEQSGRRERGKPDPPGQIELAVTLSPEVRERLRLSTSIARLCDRIPHATDFTYSSLALGPECFSKPHVFLLTGDFLDAHSILVERFREREIRALAESRACQVWPEVIKTDRIDTRDRAKYQRCLAQNLFLKLDALDQFDFRSPSALALAEAKRGQRNYWVIQPELCTAMIPRLRTEAQ